MYSDQSSSIYTDDASLYSDDNDSSMYTSDDSGAESDLSVDSSDDLDLFSEFELALDEPDWTETGFHDILCETYFSNIDENWIKFVKDAVKEYNTDDYRPYIYEFLAMQQLPETYVGNCSFCDEVKTISRAVTFNHGDVYYAGKNCARLIEKLVHFYIRMVDNMSFPYDDHKIELSKIIRWLEKNFGAGLEM